MDQLRNPLPTLTADEKKWGLRYLLFQICFLSSILQLVNGILSRPLSTAMLNFLYFSINCTVTLCIFSRFMKKNCLRAIRFPKQTLLYALAGFGVYWLSSSVLNGLIYALFPGYGNLNDGQLLELTDSAPLFMILGTVLLAPIAEEIMHRGMIFGTLYGKNIYLSYGLSAFFFSLIHVIGYIGVYPFGYFLLAIIQYLPAGLVFAWFYQRSGSILTPILIHMLNNAVVLLLSR